MERDRKGHQRDTKFISVRKAMHPRRGDGPNQGFECRLPCSSSRFRTSGLFIDSNLGDELEMIDLN
jgi:hypothetical protein